MKNKLFFLLYVFMLIWITPSSYAGSTVVARVNGVPITSDRLDAEVDGMIRRLTYHNEVSDEKRAQFRETALENLINMELVYQDAVVRGVKPDFSRVKTAMKQIRSKYQSEGDYEDALKKADMTEDDLLTLIEKGERVRASVEKTAGEPSRMSETELKRYYDKNTYKFRRPARVKLRLISCKEKQKAEKALAKIQAGSDFGDVAARMSEDQYRLKGGEVGYIHRGRALPEIENAAFKIEVGKTSDPIKAGDRWFIIEVEDRQPETQLSFKETKADLKKELEKKRFDDRMKKWIDKLRAKAKIEKISQAKDE